MKVLLVDQFGKTTGRDTLALAELINKKDYIEMQVFLSDNTEIPADRKYSVKIIKGFHDAYVGNIINKTKNYLMALGELKRYIELNDIDIIHLQWFSLPWIEWLYVGRIAKKHKVVITVHDVIPFDNRPLEMKSLDRIYSRANMLLMHTNSSKALFQQTYNTTTPISVITQGFCLKSDYIRLNNIEAKAHFGIPENAVVFLYYGTIRPSKGLDILIKAIHMAHTENEDIYLLAAGAFHKVDENEMRSLIEHELTDEYSTMNFGFVPQDEEQWYFSAANVLCLPYLEVTQSGVAQLGLMYDLPIIATDVGEMSDVVRNGENGIIIKPGEVNQLASAIVELAEDGVFRKSASLKSKELGENEFSLKEKAERVYQVYAGIGGSK